MGRGLGKGLSSARTRRCPGEAPPPLPPPRPTTRPGPIGHPMVGPGAGARARLAAATLSEFQVMRRVLREGGSRTPMYRPWLSLSLRYCNNTGIRPPGSDTETVADSFTHKLR